MEGWVDARGGWSCGGMSSSVTGVGWSVVEMRPLARAPGGRRGAGARGGFWPRGPFAELGGVGGGCGKQFFFFFFFFRFL